MDIKKDVKKKVREEVEYVMKKKGGEINLEEIKEMK